VALGAGGLHAAKGAHDEAIKDRRQPHEIPPQELANLPKCPAVREQYEGPVTVIGKDVTPEAGMRVRMNEGYLSQGVGTIVEVYSESQEYAGCCAVIWDSDQCHTRHLHSHMGNQHLCRVGKEGDHDLVLAEGDNCGDFEIKAHTICEKGQARTHLQVVAKCSFDEKDVAEMEAAVGSTEPEDKGTEQDGAVPES